MLGGKKKSGFLLYTQSPPPGMNNNTHKKKLRCMNHVINKFFPQYAQQQCRSLHTCQRGGACLAFLPHATWIFTVSQKKKNNLVNRASLKFCFWISISTSLFDCESKSSPLSNWAFTISKWSVHYLICRWASPFCFFLLKIQIGWTNSIMHLSYQCGLMWAVSNRWSQNEVNTK